MVALGLARPKGAEEGEALAMMMHRERAGDTVSRAVWCAGQPFAADLEGPFRSLAALEPKEAAVERGSLVWAVHGVIQGIALAREAIERGDAREAAEAAFMVGLLAQDFELRFRWESTVEKALTRQEQQRAAARATAEKRRQDHACWRRKAEALRVAHPKWSASRVAREIDPERWNTIRKIIGQ